MRQPTGFSRHAATMLLTVFFLVSCSQGETDGADTAATDTAMPAANTATAPALPADEQAADQLILAFGDSLTAGYGLAQDESYPARLEAALKAQGHDVRVHNAGVSGDTSSGGVARLGWVIDALPRAPDLVLLGLGANDALRGVDPALTRQNLTAMMDELKQRQIPVVLLGMQAPRNLGTDYATAFDSIFPDLAQSYGAMLYPFLLDGVVLNPALNLDDGIHPNAAGVAIIVERMLPLVHAALSDAG